MALCMFPKIREEREILMDVLYEVIKDNKIIANMVRRDTIFCVMNELVEMMDNYNKRLAKYSSLTSSHDLLGLRFFDRKDMYGENGPRSDHSPEIYPDSRKYIKREHPLIFIAEEEECYTEDGLIALIESDMERNRNDMNHIVTIDLDKNSIKFDNLSKELEHSEYQEKNLCKISELNTCEYDFSNINLNELEDVGDFISHNALGWLSDEAPGKVILSYGI